MNEKYRCHCGSSNWKIYKVIIANKIVRITIICSKCNHGEIFFEDGELK